MTEESKRRARLVVETLTRRILEAIPYNDWVSAAGIAPKVGVSSQKVGRLIRYNLLHKHVERRWDSLKPMRYLYRRIHSARFGIEKEEAST